MPEIDGYEATRTLRASGNNTPVIGLTASTLAEDRKEGVHSGMNEFIEKPLTTDRLGEVTISGQSRGLSFVSRSKRLSGART